MDEKKVLLIGGYGLAGSRIARLLMEKTSFSVIIGGRDLDKANKAAADIYGTSPGNRLRCAYVDVHDAASIKKALENCDLVIDCIPLNTAANVEMAREAMSAGIDYLNLNINRDEREKMNAAFQALKRHDLHLLTHCGIFPGLPSILVRAASARFDRLDSVTVGMIGSATEGSVNSSEEMISADIKTPAVYRENGWQKASLSAAKNIDFGPPFGVRKCYLCNLDEIEEQPKKLNIGELGVYAAEANSFIMIVLVIWNLLKLNKLKKGIESGAKLMNWGVKKFAKAPFGITVKIEAMGEIGGVPRRLEMRMFCGDVYEATAICAVACLLQSIDGRIGTCGVSYMGHAVDVDGFFEDAKRLGMNVNVSLNEAPAQR